LEKAPGGFGSTHLPSFPSRLEDAEPRLLSSTAVARKCFQPVSQHGDLIVTVDAGTFSVGNIIRDGDKANDKKRFIVDGGLVQKSNRNWHASRIENDRLSASRGKKRIKFLQQFSIVKKCYLERNELANANRNVKRPVGGAGVRRRVRPVQLVRPEAEDKAQGEGGSSRPRYAQTAGNVCTSANWERRPRQVQDE
ncbi:MAG: hypothetical protein BJ554DRAFT_7663, partial [Olpidium bornovanus]